jgi:hypothetical protein
MNMINPSSKELYMMNGGKLWYIYKDGFGDIYSATTEEEAEWAKELIEDSLVQIGTECNRVKLFFCIDDLVYHRYQGLEELLLKYSTDPVPSRQIVFATVLWTHFRYPNSFDLIIQNLVEHRNETIDDVFLSLAEFWASPSVRAFLVSCLLSQDLQLASKALHCLSSWSWAGLPELRQKDKILERLALNFRGTTTFNQAISELRVFLELPD